MAFEKSLISRTRKLVGIYRAAMERGMISPRIMDEGRELTREYVDKAVKDGVRAFIVGAIGVEDAIAHDADSAVKTIRRSCSANASA